MNPLTESQPLDFWPRTWGLWFFAKTGESQPALMRNPFYRRWHIRLDLAVESNRLNMAFEVRRLYHRVAYGGKGYSVNGGRVCRDTSERRGLFNLLMQRRRGFRKMWDGPESIYMPSDMPSTLACPRSRCGGRPAAFFICLGVNQ